MHPQDELDLQKFIAVTQVNKGVATSSATVSSVPTLDNDGRGSALHQPAASPFPRDEALAARDSLPVPIPYLPGARMLFGSRACSSVRSSSP